jgi:hypothetical protein
VPNSGFRPGFLDALGRWFDSSREAWESQFKDTQDKLDTLGSQATGAAKDAASAAQQAAGAVIGLPAARMVTGRQICAVAPNGGADCQAAADALCRGKGFPGGKSAEVMSSQRCPTRVWIAGGRDPKHECKLETFVIRAVCN